MLKKMVSSSKVIIQPSVKVEHIFETSIQIMNAEQTAILHSKAGPFFSFQNKYFQIPFCICKVRMIFCVLSTHLFALIILLVGEKKKRNVQKESQHH